MTDEYTPAEIGRTLKRLDDGQVRMESKLDTLTAGFVPRGEFVAWQTGIGREIGDLKAAKAPWWSIAPIVVSMISVALVAIPLISK